VICASCRPAAPPQKKAAAPVPKTRAVVVTIRTVIQPDNKTIDHAIVIANGRARSTDELDRWRLFDFKNDRVTFVDDISKTFRNVPMTDLVRDRLGTLHAPLQDNVPRAQLVPTKEHAPIQSADTVKYVVRLGGYVHELRIGVHPSIPPQLFAMMLASRPPSSPFEPVMRSVDEALLGVKGFPLAEHSELPYGNKKIVVDKSVVSIVQRDVPQSMLNVPASYRNVGVTPASGTLR
jgi:hypothetical protein